MCQKALENSLKLKENIKIKNKQKSDKSPKIGFKFY